MISLNAMYLLFFPRHVSYMNIVCTYSVSDKNINSNVVNWLTLLALVKVDAWIQPQGIDFQHQNQRETIV